MRIPEENSIQKVLFAIKIIEGAMIIDTKIS